MADLARSLGIWRGTAMMLNIVLGAGLLTLPGLARAVAGEAALAVWLACALAAAPLLAVFAVLGRRYPDAGGIAAILKRAFGRAGYVPATFLFLGAEAVGLPSIAITGGHYAAAALGGPVHLYAAILILLAAGANLLSAERAGRINAAIASGLVAILVILAVLGWAATGDAAAPAPAPAMPPDMASLALAFMMVFFAFTGWEVAANLGAEFRRPERDLPRAMALSFAIAVALYLVLALVVARAGPSAATEAPFTAIFASSYGGVGAAAVSVVSMVLVFANLSAAIWAVSRMVYSAAGEGLVPARLAHVNRGVPFLAVLATSTVLLGVVAVSASGLLDLGGLLAVAGMNFLLLYAGAALALVALSSRRLHSRLGIFSLCLVAVLIAGRGFGALVYPGALILAGLVVAELRGRVAIFQKRRSA